MHLLRNYGVPTDSLGIPAISWKDQPNNDALAKEAAKAERAWRKTIPGVDLPGDRKKSRRKRRGGYITKH